MLFFINIKIKYSAINVDVNNICFSKKKKIILKLSVRLLYSILFILYMLISTKKYTCLIKSCLNISLYIRIVITFNNDLGFI